MKNIRVIKTDVINNNAVANTLQDVTGLEFATKANQMYSFYVLIPYTSAATTTGARWVANTTSTPTFISTAATYTLTATTQTLRYESAKDSPSTSNGNALTAGNMLEMTGFVKTPTDDTLKIRFASEVANSAITAKAGGYIEWFLSQ